MSEFLGIFLLLELFDFLGIVYVIYLGLEFGFFVCGIIREVEILVFFLWFGLMVI